MRALLVVVRRLAGAVGTLVAVSVVLFAASEVLPGDAATASLGANATPDQVAAVRELWGLDRPLPVRYADWFAGLLHGDLGVSLVDRQPVTALVAQPLQFTAILVAIAGAATVVLALLVGVLAGLHPGRAQDRLLSGAAVTAVAVPHFVTASLLVLVLSSGLGLLPAVSLVPVGGTPLDRPEILVQPVLALSVFGTAWASRLVRAAVIDANAGPGVEAARLAGLPEHLVVWRHLLPATVPTCAQAFGWLVSGLFGGTAVVEQVFNYPGLSAVLLAAVRHHDPAVLEGVGLLLAAIIVAAFIVADLLGVLADPRARTAAS